jgi:hypothetical protein
MDWDVIYQAGTGLWASEGAVIFSVEGKIFNTMKEAEAHGLELAREWVGKKTVRTLGPLQAAGSAYRRSTRLKMLGKRN